MKLLLNSALNLALCIALAYSVLCNISHSAEGSRLRATIQCQAQIIDFQTAELDKYLFPEP